MTAQQLYALYLELHKKAVQSMGISVLASNHETASPISYNLAITNKGMVVCPRTSEGITITGTKGEPIGPVALNGTLLAGTLLLKSEGEWDTLRNDESMLIEILSSIGVSSIKKGTRI
jgi:ATP adenylyltransferase